MKIKREDFLKKLELIQFGVPARETVSFSKAFIFLNGEVCTYDDEILCRIPLCDASPTTKEGKKLLEEWKKVAGAVEAQRLLGILRKITDEYVHLEQRGGEFVILGQDREEKGAYFKMERIEGQDLPSNQVEKPTKFLPLPQDFGEAIGIVQACAKEKDSVFSRTCIYISRNYIQAYDNFQVIRLYMENKRLQEGEYVLIRKDAIKHIATLGMKFFSVTDSWVHFCQDLEEEGLTYSCRKWLEQYPDEELTAYLNADGKEITLPKGLEQAIDVANEFSQEHADANRVRIDLTGNKTIVTGQGITGKYFQKVKMDEVAEEEFSFLIAPSLLTSIVKKSTKVRLSTNTLVVDGKSNEYEWKYLAILVSPDEVEMGETANEEETGDVYVGEDGDDE